MIFFNWIYFFYRYLIAILFLLLAASFSPVFAQIDSRLIAEGWQEFTFEDKQENRFKRVGKGIIEMKQIALFRLLICRSRPQIWICTARRIWPLNGSMKGKLWIPMCPKRAEMTVYWRFIWRFPINRNMPLLKKNYCDRWWWPQGGGMPWPAVNLSLGWGARSRAMV